jgi:hypothetical protein
MGARTDAGVPVEEISRLVGHSGTTVTELVYLSKSPDAGRMGKAAEYLPIAADLGD